MTNRRHSAILDRQRLRPLGLVLLLVVLALGFQGTRGIWSPDEGLHTVTSRTMLESGDWLIPRIVNQVYLDKPPLSLWGIAAGMWLLGTNEWGARLAHAVWYLLTTLLVFVLGRELWDERSGRLAAILYATMLLPFVAANIVTPDTPLTFWTTASMVAFWFARERSGPGAEWWKVVLGVVLALGVWTKGPAALIPCAAMLVVLAATGALRSFFVSWGMVLGAFTFLTIGGSWYAYVGAVVPGGLTYLWDNHVAGRLVSASYQRNPGLTGAIEVYLPVLLGGTLPASAACWLALKNHWRMALRLSFWQRLRNSHGDLLVVCWIVVPCLVLAVASSKLTLYVLPVFPAIALLCARLGRSEAEARRVPVSWLGLPVRWSWPFAVWIAAMLALKLIGGVVDTDRDMRQLATQLRSFVPPSPFEVVCIDFSCEGLAFYLGDAMESVTTSSTPYPVFGGTEPLSEELSELPKAPYHHLVVYEAKRDTAVREAMARYTGLCSDDPIPLPHGRRAIVCRAAREGGAVIAPEVDQLDRESPIP
jgi:4-amino-4-deoxy-L-arabinose transferase